MVRLLTRLLALCLVLPPAGALAAPVRLAVADPWSPPNLAGIAAKVTLDVTRIAQGEPGTVVLPPEEVARTLGPVSLKKLQECAGRAACVAENAGALEADRMVVGSVDRTEDTYVVKLFLIDLRAKTVLATVDRQVLIASRRLQADVAAAIPAFLKGRAEATGALEVTTNRPGASVILDGEPAGRTPVTITAKPGKHSLKITRENSLPIERFVVVEEGKTTKVALTLTPVPGSAPEEDPLAVAARAGGSGVSIPAATWAAGGVALVAGGVGTWFALAARSLDEKAGPGPVYAISRAEAIGGRRDALLANVCFGAAGAALLTGVVLGVVLQPDTAPAPRAAVVPLADGAAVALSGSF